MGHVDENGTTDMALMIQNGFSQLDTSVQHEIQESSVLTVCSPAPLTALQSLGLGMETLTFSGGPLACMA